METFFVGIAKKMSDHVEGLAKKIGHTGEQGASNERQL